MIRAAILSTALAFLGASLSPAAQHWIRLTSPHFRMYTTNGESKAVDALRTFEEAEAFFAAKAPANALADVPADIIAFTSEKEYAPYRVNKNAAAYYQHGHKCDFIVMQQLGRTYFPAAIHEYTHLVIEHAGLHLPLWLNEGLADVYSSLETQDNKLVVGMPPPGRVNALLALGSFDVRVLFSVNRESDYYNKPQAMAQFYAESWELAHMLQLGQTYRQGFPRFLAELSGGKTAEQAFSEVYGRSVDDLNRDLRSYLSRGEVPITRFDLHLDERQLKPAIAEPSQFELDLLFADLLSTHPETTEEARLKLMQLALQAPADPGVQESLAYVAWQQNKLGEARQHFDAALKDGAKSARLLFDYAGVLHQMHAPPREIMPLLQQALELQPDFYDARYDLAMEALRVNECGTVMEAFAGLKTVESEHAFSLFSTEAYCQWRLGNPQEGRRLAEQARQYVKTPDELKRIDDLIDQLNRVNPPP